VTPNRIPICLLSDIAAASAALMVDQLQTWTARKDRGFEPLQHALEATIYAFCESASITPCNPKQSGPDIDSLREPTDWLVLGET
jgi:hypothetical protein